MLLYSLRVWFHRRCQDSTIFWRWRSRFLDWGKGKIFRKGCWCELVCGLGRRCGCRFWGRLWRSQLIAFIISQSSQLLCWVRQKSVSDLFYQLNEWNQCSLLKGDFVYFPLFDGESSFDVACESLTWLGVSGIFEVVVADREFGVWFLDIWVVNDANIAAAEDRTFVGVTGYGKLGQIQAEFFSQIHRKDEGSQRFVRSPVFFGRIPGQRSVPSDNFSVLCFQDGQSISHVIAFFMEFCYREIILACPVKQRYRLDIWLCEEWSDVLVITGNFETHSWNFRDGWSVCW